MKQLALALILTGTIGFATVLAQEQKGMPMKGGGMMDKMMQMHGRMGEMSGMMKQMSERMKRGMGKTKWEDLSFRRCHAPFHRS